MMTFKIAGNEMLRYYIRIFLSPSVLFLSGQLVFVFDCLIVVCVQLTTKTTTTKTNKYTIVYLVFQWYLK